MLKQYFCPGDNTEPGAGKPVELHLWSEHLGFPVSFLPKNGRMKLSEVDLNKCVSAAASRRGVLTFSFFTAGQVCVRQLQIPREIK